MYRKQLYSVGYYERADEGGMAVSEDHEGQL